MNETQLIRRQLALERAHLGAVAQACADAAGTATLSSLREAGAEYLRCVLGWFEARDERLASLAAGLDDADPRGAALTALLARTGGSGEALALLAATPGDARGWQGLARLLEGPWGSRRDALEQLLANDSRAADWRVISGIDADRILEERARFAQVSALLPPGLAPGAAAPRVA